MNRPARLMPAVLSVAASLLLGSCGLIPTPSVDVPDSTLNLPDSGTLNGKVVYLYTDSLKGNSVPAALSRFKVEGNATYTTAAGTLSRVGMYIRPDLSNVPATCTEYPASLATPRMLVCSEAGEQAQAIGTLTLKAGQGMPFSLGGAALDAAARGGHGYFGMSFSEGRSLFGDTLKLSEMKASARL
ncbi:hypothetical protein GCM10008959_04810 [Deinococcus seoulensis]|uniref:Lipoprotein n=1 Tax=Deinococcus seoulensis TaxID=1837379 RepID=A0ABQ2RMB5_9DEIO|nr:hypothetical protein [Deinococcus seoulensis]GGR46801.1 hypothetical protein GCM10008959_04810 [Deinococcus seoulensis]